MKERNKTHLIYLDPESRVFIQEHGIGAKHPKDAEFFCEVPSNEDSRWIIGKPSIPNIQFLTLSPFYPTQRLDVSVEINNEPKVMSHVNHPAFAGCVKYMPIHLLDFRPMPKYIARSIHTIGLCSYGKQEPYKTVDIEEDNKLKAIEKGRKLLNPNSVEHVIYLESKSNEEYDKHYNNKPKLTNNTVQKIKP